MACHRGNFIFYNEGLILLLHNPKPQHPWYHCLPKVMIMSQFLPNPTLTTYHPNNPSQYLPNKLKLLTMVHRKRLQAIKLKKSATNRYIADKVEGFTCVTSCAHTCWFVKAALCLWHCMWVVGLCQLWCVPYSPSLYRYNNNQKEASMINTHKSLVSLFQIQTWNYSETKPMSCLHFVKCILVFSTAIQAVLLPV